MIVKGRYFYATRERYQCCRKKGEDEEGRERGKENTEHVNRQEDHINRTAACFYQHDSDYKSNPSFYFKESRLPINRIPNTYKVIIYALNLRS